MIRVVNFIAHRCPPGPFFGYSFFFIWALCCLPVMAESPPPGPAGRLPLWRPPVTLEQIRNKIAGIEKASGLGKAQKEKLLRLYRQAEESLRAAKTYKERAQAYRQSLISAPARIEAINEQLDRLDTGEKLAAIKQRAEVLPLSELEQRLGKKKAKLAALKSTLARLNRQLRAQQNRPRQTQKALAQAKRQVERLEKALQEWSPSEKAPRLAEARRTVWQARLKARLNEIAMLKQALLSHGVRWQLLTARRHLTVQQIARTRAVIELLQALILQRRQIKASKAREAAARIKAAATGQYPVIRQLAQENAQLSKKLASLVARLERVTAVHEAVEAQLRQIKQDFRSTRQKLEIAGSSQAVQQILQNQRRSLANLNLPGKDIEHYREEAAEVGLNQFRINERRRHLNEFDNLAARIVATQVDSELSRKRREAIEARIRKLIETQKTLLDKIYATQAQYLQALESLIFARQQLLETVERYTAFLDEHLLWIPSTAPLGWKTLSDLAASSHWLFSLEGWGAALRALKLAAVDKLFLVIPLALLWIGLLLTRYRLPRTLELIAERVAMPYADRFSFTLRALLATLLAAAPWPLLLGAAGWLLQTAAETSGFVKAAGAGLTAIALPLLLLYGWQLLCCRRGVAEAHFDWHPRVLTVWRRNMRWAVPALIPILFVTAMTRAARLRADPVESLGQLSFMVGMLTLAVFFQRVLKPQGGIVEQYLADNPTGGLSRFRYIWYPAVVGLPVVLVGLAAIGYYYTALHLNNGMIVTLQLVIAAVLVHDLVVRWLVVTQRKLALVKLRERREIVQATQSTLEGASRAGAGAPAELHIPQLDIQKVDEHTRRLLRMVVVLGVVTGLWVIWASTFPAFGILNEVTLWRHGAAAKGQAVPQSFARAAPSEFMPATSAAQGQAVPESFTLGDLLVALAVALLAFGATRNLPGVLEILVLRRLSLAPGSRYAITALVRYAIGIAGVLLVVEFIGGSWSQFQWLVAALTVGLGFGLQEIFANFVSGLIILFERPIRVGDVVTIGDISATVSRIRTRATTITDFDNKELIIPNKTFVTDNIINWTLSDSITRVTAHVGVAYGSDTQRVHQIILDVVKDNPLALAEPEPSVYFAGFGAYSLDFVVWVFVQELGDRFPLLHELNTAINRALRAQGIEIPVPQRAIYVRSTSTGLMPTLEGRDSQGAGIPPSAQPPCGTPGTYSGDKSPEAQGKRAVPRKDAG